ncbi:MAG: U32 family peptidase [Candidatus Gastranaerophilales bacterium]|nr:U32 family peptidase [Candidatus Gastranaerophilales bacterium]
MKKIELLAPAKDAQIAKSAINFGADAVYIGAEKFGARSKAGNSIREIEELISYAHQYSAKIYITLNTILTDKEIPEAQKLIYKLYDIGADAIIIQDIGLLEIDLPPISLHASTQMNNDSLEKILFLQDTGIKRVVLPREFSLEQIKEISSKTDIELEYFIHGALCVSYSGQCYMSCANGGRSANRGECAQPCRKTYTLLDENSNILIKDKYLLSLKDFNLSDNLLELLDAGVTSLKIEGRMKDEPYVKNVVAYYRKKLDYIFESSEYLKSSDGIVNFDFEPDLNKSFNRGFTKYFLFKREKNLINQDTPKALGEKIGTVVKIEKDKFTVKTDKTLSNGDGVCFFTKDKELKGTLINNVKENIITVQNISGIEPGTIIYRNFDIKFEKALKNSSTTRKIPAQITVEDGLILKITDGTNTVDVQIQQEFEKAQKEEGALNNIKKQLSKSGGGIFEITEVTINLKEIPFISINTLNEIRRELFAALQNLRIGNNTPKGEARVDNAKNYPIEELDYSANIHNKYAENFYLKHGCTIVEKALESTSAIKDKKLMTTKFCLKSHLGKCGSNKLNWSLIDEKKQKYKLIFNCQKCQMEIYSI